MELNHLTEEERDRIISVLRRDEQLRSQDLDRVRQLKTDVKRVRLKGVIKSGHDPTKTCARCREKFGWLFNKGLACPQCQHTVCQACRVNNDMAGEGSWLCILCFKQMELNAMSGQWFLMKFRKSKRNRRTNKVITGQEIIATSIGRRHLSPGGSGSEASRTGSMADDPRKSLSNNNSSPIRSVGSANIEESSDTQSTASLSPGLKKRASDVHEMGFPKESDKHKLMALIRSKTPGIGSPRDMSSPIVEVRKVSLSRYRSDSESSSSDSAPSSPQFSARTDSEFRYSDSIRSSFRSTGAFSAVSSEGRITIVTESCVSDMDTYSLSSMISDSRSTTDGAASPNSKEIMYDKDIEHFRSSDSVIENKAHRANPQFSKLTGLSRDINDGSVSISDSEISVRKVISSKHADSMSSDSDGDDMSNDQMNKLKLRRIQISHARSRSPSPEPRSRVRQSNGTVNKHNNGHSDGISVTSSLTESDAGSASPRERASSQRSSTTNLPAINVSHHGNLSRDDDSVSSSGMGKVSSSDGPSTTTSNTASPQHYHGSAGIDTAPGSGTEEEGEDIDELVASHTSPSHSVYSQKGGSMLSPFSGSRESIVSFYSNAGEGIYGNVAISGDIQFSLEYNYKTSSLEVRIKQCRDLAAVDSKKKRSDPYVKIYLLPDKTKSGKRKTRVKKHTLNPVFDEVLRFSLMKSELETRTLWMTVWNCDTFGRNDFLGEVTIPLDYYTFGEAGTQWYKLQERNASPLSLLTYKGDLILSLKYVTGDNAPSVGAKARGGGGVGRRRPGCGELHVLLKEARNLTAVRANGFSDPFCKGYLLPEKGRGTKQKTPVVKRDCNPQWNHTLVFEDITLDDLRDRSLELTIWDHDRFISNDFLGGLRLNIGAGKVGGKEVDWMDSRGEEVSMWQSMLDRPNCWIDGSLMLRTTMERRK